MKCIICLSNFETNEALIPELRCSCILVVHEECWDQWTGACLYCREYPEQPQIHVIEIHRPPNFIQISVCYFVLLILITWIQYYTRMFIVGFT
jgi:hypothetical protein